MKNKHDTIEGVWTETNHNALEDCSQIEAECFNAGVNETIENVEEMMIDEVRPERGSDEWLSSDVRNQFRAKLRHQLSQLKIKSTK